MSKPEVTFTPYQVYIIEQWAKTQSIAGLAQAIDRSEHTVQTQLKRMRRKISVNRTFDVYQYMVEQNLL